jgi:hypothetical protein
MGKDYKVGEISTGRIGIKQTCLVRTCMETTHSKVIEMQNDGRRWRGGMKGTTGLGGRFELKHKEGEGRGNGKIDYRVRTLERGAGKRHMHKDRDREEGRRGWEYLEICLGDRHLLSLFLNGVESIKDSGLKLTL